MGRLLLWVLGTCFLLWWVGALRPRRAPSRPQAPRADSDTARMVRDRMCNTFLPEARALMTRRDGEDYFFCSPACQTDFLEARQDQG